MGQSASQAAGTKAPSTFDHFPLNYVKQRAKQDTLILATEAYNNKLKGPCNQAMVRYNDVTRFLCPFYLINTRMSHFFLWV